jgi:hypothetical protein
MFREVVLTDVVCLPEVRKKIRNHGNVTFVEQDVSGIAEDLYRNRLQGIHELPEVTASSRWYNNSDLVVSLNILSQLWVIPRQYAIKELPGLTEDRLDDWCRQIVESHYASLRNLCCNVCLITDYEFVKRDREGTIFSRGSTVSRLELPKPDASWLWNIAPTEENNHSKELLVGAWHIA